MSSAPDLSIDLLKAIAHPLRHAILCSLARGERNVGEIETATGIGQPTLSQQLSVLRQAGLVVARREAKLVFYQIDRDTLAQARGALDAICLDEPGTGARAGMEPVTGAGDGPEPRAEAAKTPGGTGRGELRSFGGAAVFARLS